MLNPLARNLGIAALAGLAALNTAGCSPQPGIENPDLTITSSYEVYSQDHFQTDGPNTISARCNLLNDSQAQSQPQGAMCRLGSWDHSDTHKSDEVLNLYDAGGQTFMQLRQNEVRSGFINHKSEEALQATFKGQPVANVSELEGAGFMGSNPVDKESGHILGSDRGYSTTELEWGSEAVLSGHLIESDYQGRPLSLEARHGNHGFFNSWLGSQVKVDGQPAYNVDVLKGKIGRSVLNGYSLVTPQGQQIGSVVVNSDFNRYQDAYSFRAANGQEYGTIFREDTSPYQDSDSRPQIEGAVYQIRLQGETREEKLANLQQIDNLMTLMPGQVNQDPHRLHDMEEALDMAQALLLHSHKTTPDPAVGQAAIAIATEEDPTSLGQALEMLHPKRLSSPNYPNNSVRVTPHQ